MSKVFRPFGNSKTARMIEDPGGAIIHKVATGTTDRGANTAANNLMPWTEPLEKRNAALNKTSSGSEMNPIRQYTPPPNGISGYPAMRLGWTNGGYNFNNSPWNGQPITPANPMSMAPPLQAGGGSGTVPGAGAQPPQQQPVAGPPPTRFAVPEQEALIRGLRGR